MTPALEEQLYVLQREFGVSADEALYGRPAWELDNLLSRYRRDQERLARAHENA